MAKLPSNYSLGNVTDPAQFMQYSSIMSGDMTNVLNGNIQFDQNIKSQTVDVQFTTANADMRVEHKLGTTPTGFLPAGPSAAMILYLGTQAWDATAIYLRASAPGTSKVIIF